jgi:hypothetical protein
MENAFFCGFSASLHRKNSPAAVGRILVSGGLAPYLLDLNLLAFANRRILQAKVQAPYTNLSALRPSIIAEFDQQAAAYIRKTCRSFRRCH